MPCSAVSASMPPTVRSGAGALGCDCRCHAYAQCRSNKGAPGVDGQDFADIETYGVRRWLGKLALAIRQQTYRPSVASFGTNEPAPVRRAAAELGSAAVPGPCRPGHRTGSRPAHLRGDALDGRRVDLEPRGEHTHARTARSGQRGRMAPSFAAGRGGTAKALALTASARQPGTNSLPDHRALAGVRVSRPC
jgi:hypothetical protein